MLPRPIREAEERANRIHQQVYGGNTGEEPTPAPAPEGDSTIAAREPAPAPTPVPTPAPTPAPAPVDTWEQKYRVLEGKYRSEVPRMAAQIGELQAAIQGLRDQAAAAAAPAAPIAADIKGMSLDEVREKFGDDFSSAVLGIARDIARESVDVVRQEVTPKIDQVQQAASRNARADFMREIERHVPNWQSIDTSDGFTAFLDEADHLSGRARRDFFTEADRANDATRVIRFFKTFEALSAPPAQPPAAPPAGPAPVEYALAPPRGSSTVEVPTSKRIWRPADIRQFYQDVRQKKYTREDVQRIESDIFAAQRENRLAA